MFTPKRITIWFIHKRPIFSDLPGQPLRVRTIIDNNIAFVYGKMEKNVEKTWARINLNGKKSLDELNAFEYV